MRLVVSFGRAWKSTSLNLTKVDPMLTKNNKIVGEQLDLTFKEYTTVTFVIQWLNLFRWILVFFFKHSRGGGVVVWNQKIWFFCNFLHLGPSWLECLGNIRYLPRTSCALQRWNWKHFHSNDFLCRKSVRHWHAISCAWLHHLFERFFSLTSF